MLRGLFVTGTDTNVGKTVVCAALMHRYREAARLRYWKPIQTGIEQDDDTIEVCRLGRCGEEEIFPDGVRLRCPVSPHLAARWAGITIDLDQVAARLPKQPDTERWIIEGAGGVLVPINETELMADLIQKLALPALVVARSSLGTINHTLLTIETLRARSLRTVGVVMVGDRNSDNRDAIERYGNVPVLAELPVLLPLNSETLAAWALAELDIRGRLLEMLQ